MNFELLPLRSANTAYPPCDVMLMPVTPAFTPDRSPLSNVIDQALQQGLLPTDPGSLHDICRPAGTPCQRLVLVRAGLPTQFAEIRQAINAAVTLVKPSKPKHVVLTFLQTPTPTTLRVALTALADASYVYTTTKTKQDPRSIQRVTVFVPDCAPLADAFEHSVAVISGVELAKEWANRPPNFATPSHLAQAATDLAQSPFITCDVLGPKDVARLGMGAFMAVARGSAEPLRLIVLHYHRAPKNTAPVVLVGKGITFDSGGICLKPAADMDEMKFDMSGAASVLGVFKALADLTPTLHVVGIIPTCENLPGGSAIKPGDVVTSMSGQTIEVLNTDAEGRLILCDALTYAQGFKPRAVIDIATLTGACVIALGAVRSAFFSRDAALATALLQASETSQDLCWPMPLDDEYAEGLKSNFADTANVAGRPAGAITAAKFLQKFAGQCPWAHLDIAGTAWKTGPAKGATGRPVGLLLDYLLSLKGTERS